jgi:spermidine synthase
VRFRFGDGRVVLMRSLEPADVIQADALRPTSAYSGNLYSFEYFSLVRSRLRPGGFGVSWGPTPRTRNAFIKAFPHALVIGDILIGSEKPIAFDPDAVRRRLADP